MRIIKVEIENINSLQGYWCIDFSDPDYIKNKNQFVIHGDTGAGKTTILDAITLALYGKSPREDISKNHNEVMSKNTGFCMAAVTYECEGSHYRSEFYQQRSRKNPTGNLQEPECSIVNIDSDQTYSEVKSVSSLGKATANIIRLDYDQFCRSILLAQGSFDKFIHGDEREKADILAKLNGTEHYKLVGKTLWEKARARIAEIDGTLKEKDSIIVFSDDEVLNLKDELEKGKKKSGELQETVKKLNELINWRRNVDNCEAEYNKADAARKKYESEAEAFKSQEKILEAGEKATKCIGKYDAFQKAKGDYKDKLNKQENAVKEFQKAKNDLEEAKAQKEISQRQFKEIDEKREGNISLWKTVRDFDSKIVILKGQVDQQKRRFVAAQNTYITKKEEVDRLSDAILKDETEIENLKSYLSEHQKDEDLRDKLAGLNVNKGNVKNQLAEIKKLTDSVSRAEEELDEKNKKLANLRKEIGTLDNELKELVSTGYESISKFLRLGLGEGKACPVCGAVEHPFCKGTADIHTGGISETAIRAIQLSEELENKRNEETECKTGIETAGHSLEDRKKQLDEQKSSFRRLIDDINSGIENWNEAVDENRAEASLEEICDRLNRLDKAYKDKSDKLNELQTENASHRTRLQAIDLEGLEKNRIDEEKEYNIQNDSYKKLCEERKLVFSNNDVDTAEKKYNDDLKTAKDTNDRNATCVAELDSKLSSAETTKKLADKDVEDYKKEFDNSETALDEILKTNGFNSVDAFESGRLSEEKIEEIKADKNKLGKKDTETDTKLKEAKTKFDNEKDKALTEKSIGALEDELKQVNDEQRVVGEDCGSLIQKLNDNDERIKTRKLLEDKLKDAEKERAILETIQKRLIGVREGNDLEVFVQRLAMSNLLISANSYLSQILPDFILVQKPDSMDCVLHDANHPDPRDDRPMSNMSGGETFAVSLALALGIAEVASHKIQVESLFLDEGFGTLSGGPLAEAINALKRLQSTGKMLGIITHVEPVINEFEQKITARKVNGVSSLEGSGITRERKS